MSNKLKTTFIELKRDLGKIPAQPREIVATLLGVVAYWVIVFLMWRFLIFLGFQLNGLWFLIAALISSLGFVFVYRIVKQFFWVSISVAIAIFLTTMVIIWIIWGIPAPEEQEALSIFETRLTLTMGAIGAAVLSTVGIWNLIVNHRRTVALEGQLETQRAQLKYKRGHDKDRQHQELYVASIRDLSDVGSIYGLEQLAKESEIWAPKIATIFCKYIRSTTSKADYRKKYKNIPAVEVSTMMEVLTVPNNNLFDSTKFDLTGSSLNGIELNKANLQGAVLVGVSFLKTKLNAANLNRANLKNTELSQAQLVGADLTGADLTGADLIDANLTGANLTASKLDRVNLMGAYLIATKLNLAGMREVNLLDKNRRADLALCEFASTHIDICWGVLTDGMIEAMQKDQGTGKRENQDQYLSKNATRRELTDEEREYLVGKDNVKKCNWGYAWVLKG